MSHVVILGGGLGGTLMAFETKETMRPGDRLTLANLGFRTSFLHEVRQGKAETSCKNRRSTCPASRR